MIVRLFSQIGEIGVELNLLFTHGILNLLHVVIMICTWQLMKLLLTWTILYVCMEKGPKLPLSDCSREEENANNYIEAQQLKM